MFVANFYLIFISSFLYCIHLFFDDLTIPPMLMGFFFSVYIYICLMYTIFEQWTPFSYIRLLVFLLLFFSWFFFFSCYDFYLIFMFFTRVSVHQSTLLPYEFIISPFLGYIRFVMPFSLLFFIVGSYYLIVIVTTAKQCFKFLFFFVINVIFYFRAVLEYIFCFYESYPFVNYFHNGFIKGLMHPGFFNCNGFGCEILMYILLSCCVFIMFMSCLFIWGFDVFNSYLMFFILFFFCIFSLWCFHQFFLYSFNDMYFFADSWEKTYLLWKNHLWLFQNHIR